MMAKDNTTLSLAKGGLAGLDLRKSGDRKAAVRFVLYSAAIIFFFFLVGAWMFSVPTEPGDGSGVTPKPIEQKGDAGGDGSVTKEEKNNSQGEQSGPGGGQTQDSTGLKGSSQGGQQRDGLGKAPTASANPYSDDGGEADLDNGEESSGGGTGGQGDSAQSKGSSDHPSEETQKDNSYEKGDSNDGEGQSGRGQADENGTKSADEAAEAGKEAKLTEDAAEGKDANFKTQETEVTEEEKHDNEPGQSDTEKEALKLCEDKNWIPCLDNIKAIKALPDHKFHEHHERHCPLREEMPRCLVPLPEGWQTPILWPQSRDMIRYTNVPDDFLATYKADQNWIHHDGDYITFPGGGTQFKNGVDPYIEIIEQIVPEIQYGKHVRLALDVGCGVASWGAALLRKDVLPLSFAPADEHRAQIQFALERGVPAILEVIGRHRLPFPSRSFDLVHCARCRVHWEEFDGLYLLEINRILRPGGYFVYSATPLYGNGTEDRRAWELMADVMTKMCWSELKRGSWEGAEGVDVAVFKKTKTNECLENRPATFKPPFCDDTDSPDAAWNVRTQTCVHKIPGPGVHGGGGAWPVDWPDRAHTAPAWLAGVERGLFGSPGLEDFAKDSEHWRSVVEKSYLKGKGLGIDWTHVRNVLDMNAHYGGFAAALINQPVWVMNVVPIHALDTLPVVFDRGLVGVYHDWCEPFNTYPRTYDLVHVDHLFETEKTFCDVTSILIEVDRILRPGGWLIIREVKDMIEKLKDFADNQLHFSERLFYIVSGEGLLVMQKTLWRPTA